MTIPSVSYTLVNETESNHKRGQFFFFWRCEPYTRVDKLGRKSVRTGERIVAWCTTREAAEAARRLLTGEALAGLGREETADGSERIGVDHGV